jgi:hypothetical protein
MHRQLAGNTMLDTDELRTAVRVESIAALDLDHVDKCLAGVLRHDAR